MLDDRRAGAGPGAHPPVPPSPVAGPAPVTGPAPTPGPAPAARAIAAAGPVPAVPTDVVAPRRGVTRLRRPRLGARHRAGRTPLSGRLRAGLCWPLAAIALVGVVGARAAARPPQPGDGVLAAEAFTLLQTAAPPLPAAALSPDGVAAVLGAVYATVTQSFTRHDTLLAAGRELLFVALLISAVLLWRTARRMGCGDAASAAAVLLAGVVPVLAGTTLVGAPAQLGVPWLLLALYLIAPGRPAPATVVLAALAGVIATLLAPDVALLTLAAVTVALAVGLLRRVPIRVQRALAVPSAITLVALVPLLHRWDPLPDPSLAWGVGRATALGLGVAMVAVGVLAAWLLRRWRPLTAAVIVTAAVGIVPPGRFAALVVCLPVAGLLAGALLGGLPRPAPGLPRPVIGVLAGLAVVTTALAGVLLLRGPAADLGASEHAALLAWADDQLPADAQVVAPLRMWAELVHAGGDPERFRLPGTAADARPTRPVLDLTSGRRTGTAAAVAGFGTEPVALRLVDPAPPDPDPDAREDRVTLGTALLTNPTTSAPKASAELLRSGQVDPRLLALLTALGAQSGVGLQSLPVVAGEEDGSALVRQAVVASVGGAELTPAAPATDRLLAYLDAQLPPFAPDTAQPTDGGMLIAFRYVSDPVRLVAQSAP